MSHAETLLSTSGPALEAAIESACRRIAPVWPLDRAIAVNPHWGRIDRPFETAGDELARRAGSSLWMPPAYFRGVWERGEIQRGDLEQALLEADAAETVESLLAALDSAQPWVQPLPLPADLQPAPPGGTRPWPAVILDQLSRFCAGYFDRHQADWRSPVTNDLYAAWRQALAEDHGATLPQGARPLRRRVRHLPAEPRPAIAQALGRLGVAAEEAAPLLEAALLRINGWAGWCAYLDFEARKRGERDDSLEALLAARLAWEWLLDDGDRQPGSPWARWRSAWAAPEEDDIRRQRRRLALWQRAEEIAYQRRLLRTLTTTPTASPQTPAVQAVFCIDVRSEIFRRALEAVAPEVETRGFAGFFGLPITYSPLGTAASRPQLPGPLAPAAAVSEGSGDPARDQAIAAARRRRLSAKAEGQAFRRLPASGFALVETLGLGYLASLLRSSLGVPASTPGWGEAGLRPAESAALRPRLLDHEEPVALAERVLRGMGLVDGFAPLVLLVGHGSRSANNPQAAALDCGACCGQTGEVNARALAALLDDETVRQGLAERGIAIPEGTRFVPALHNTTTDEVALFDLPAETSAEEAGALAQLRRWLAQAGDRARAERAPTLGLGGLQQRPAALLRALRRRARDWSETRPEWGLAGNASFIAAPRRRTRGMDLGGRAFLHDYDWRQDPDGAVLELIMTAPMVVAHWINLQYYASTVDNPRFGSGDKVLHNVVGGRIGVLEGNGGDLRAGLAWQSLHDGELWRHAPLRLTVCIDAPRGMIEAVINQHETVRQLVDNRWLYLFRMADQGLEAYAAGDWQVLPGEAVEG